MMLGRVFNCFRQVSHLTLPTMPPTRSCNLLAPTRRMLGLVRNRAISAFLLSHDHSTIPQLRASSVLYRCTIVGCVCFRTSFGRMSVSACHP